MLEDLVDDIEGTGVVAIPCRTGYKSVTVKLSYALWVLWSNDIAKMR